MRITNPPIPPMTTPINDLPDLFFDQLRDIHSVESQVAGTLPHLSRLAALPALRGLFSEQHHLTLEQQRRVAAIFETHSREIGPDECQAMQGLIAGGNEHLERTDDPKARDLMLVAHWLRIKHYEIAAYQFAAALALQLDYIAERELLSTFLAAEESAAKELDGVAAELFVCGCEEAESSGASNAEP